MLNILNILNKKYGIIEQDLASAEIELVPAFKARTMGLDESMVAAYGQDDKICAYTSLHAMMEYSCMYFIRQRRNRKHGKHRNGISYV